MRVSACIITYNEEESISHCLKYLLSLNNLYEICIVDSFSTDKTMQIINSFCLQSKTPITVKQQAFQSFGRQKNSCIGMASGDWILLIDADETYSQALDHLLYDLPRLNHVNAIRIPTLVTIGDRKHYLESGNLDPHIRIWRNGLARYAGDVHEILFDRTYRDLHSAYDPDILNTTCHPSYGSVVMVHHQLLKSKKSLLQKGERWESLGAIEGSNRRGIPVHKQIWADWQVSLKYRHPIAELPKEFWDVCTED